MSKKDENKKGDVLTQDYRLVAFKDVATGDVFLVHSSVETKGKTLEHEGKEYPLYEIEVSSASHPFYTGKQRFVGGAGKLEKFRQRMEAAKKFAQGKKK